jgi:TonB family protein
MIFDPLAEGTEKRDRFWATFGIVLAIHVVVIGGTVAVSRWLFPHRAVEKITWLDGGLVPASQTLDEPSEPDDKTEPPSAEPEQPEPPKPEDSGELPIAVPTPTPAPTPKPTPKPTTTKRPTSRPKEREPQKKAVVKTPAKPKATPAPTPAPESPAAPKPAESGASTENAVAQPGTKTGPGAAGGTGTSVVVAEAMKKYGNQIEARFNALWEQPVTGDTTSAQKLMGTISFRVAADGAVVWIKLSKSSGNRLVDDSLEAVCRRVKSLPPPPPSICPSGFFQNGIVMVLDR